MAITSSDIKLMQSERLTEDSDGGGQMTGLSVIDGDINNLFEDISRIDRTYGDVSLRKAFLKVDTATADLYLDSHAILSAQPQDPNVSGLLFTTDDFYDQRSAARSRIESFVVPGPVTGLNLRGTQLQGQKSLIVYAPKINNVRAPEIGETYMLQFEQDLNTRQFVKVLNVLQSTERFTYFIGSSGDPRTFEASQYILELSAELARDYPAPDPNLTVVSKSRLYSTQAASSAKYYGTTTLSDAVEAGATSIKVADTFAPIIPTASSETPVIDQRPGGYLNHIVSSSSSSISVGVSATVGATSQLPTAVVPGSCSFTLAGTNYVDKGGRFLTDAGAVGTLSGSVIDYRTGLIQWAGSAAPAGVTFSYTPGAVRQQLPNTGRIEIDETNRNFNYVLSLDPPPAPGTFNASYQYLGKWYELQDDGTGLLTGEGSGQVNYATGSIVLTLQAQPDAGSIIFYRWTEGTIYDQVAGQAYNDTTPVYISLSNGQVVPGSVSMTWTAGGTTKTATDAAANGVISGDATGRIDYASGRITLTVATLPTNPTGWSISYTHKKSSPQTTLVAVPDNSTRANINLTSAANIQPGSVSFNITKSIRRRIENASGVKISESVLPELYRIFDNGEGALISDRVVREVVGSVNYASGLITITGTAFLKIRS